MADVKRIVAETFLEMAEALETGTFGKRPRIIVTGLGSEHGEKTVIEGALLAKRQGVDVIYIGTETHPSLTCIEADCEQAVHQQMESLLTSKKADGAVTMHYPFPIGVSTVGRVQTPAKGATMYLATTTGTSSTDRVEGMVKNAVYGIIAAKACGNQNPTVGIANVDGARQCETALKKLCENGYKINFASSARADGGIVMRGNDLLTASADIMVTDPLTGNILMKMLSAFNTGGSYEATGWGYGPGIGEGQDHLIMIVSRASGAQVIAGALTYAAELVLGDWKTVMKQELEAANRAGLSTVAKPKKQAVSEPVEAVAPPREVVTATISGIEVMDLEDAVACLWKAGIYAESGMGCTGPIILVSEERVEAATEALKTAAFIGN